MKQNPSSSPVNSEQAVRERYAAAAQESEPALCCPVSYNPRYLKAIPEEILEKDYGCGDPTPFVKPGDRVLDLGSGGGKLCYIASQAVGPKGHVIGVDTNNDMLQLARKYQSTVAERLGFANVEFRCGRIQDLGLDLEMLTQQLDGLSLDSPNDLLALRDKEQVLRNENPLIEDNSIDCVISNCVLNLVDPADRKKLFAEIFRVLKVGGRAAISDIVCDEAVPQAMQDDPTLWSGCISGAWQESQFVEEFRLAGLANMDVVKLEQKPWQTVQGIEFRSMTILAYKVSDAPCLDQKHAVVYRGPFEKATSDDGSTYVRGQRTAVCGKTFRMLQSPPFANYFIGIEPREAVSEKDAPLFDCKRDQLRSPKETKGAAFDLTVLQEGGGGSCGTNGCC